MNACSPLTPEENPIARMISNRMFILSFIFGKFHTNTPCDLIFKKNVTSPLFCCKRNCVCSQSFCLCLHLNNLCPPTSPNNMCPPIICAPPLPPQIICVCFSNFSPFLPPATSSRAQPPPSSISIRWARSGNCFWKLPRKLRRYSKYLEIRRIFKYFLAR